MTLKRSASEAPVGNALFHPLVLHHQPANHLAVHHLPVLANPFIALKSSSQLQTQQQSGKAHVQPSATSNKSELEVLCVE
jgi:hypothetical protein